MDIFAKCYEPSLATELQEKGVYPYFRALQSRQDVEVMMEGKRRIMLGSNNYLGLTTDPEVIEAGVRTMEQYGTGCSGSRFLNGTLQLHLELEEALAGFLRKEEVITFGTGFQSNVGIISALVGRHDYVICDRENHASIYAGCQMSYGKMLRYRHSDMEDLEKQLARVPEQNGALILLGVKVRENALILNKPLKELCGADAPYHIVAIKRGDETLIPHGNHSLIAGDVVYFMTTPDYIDIIRDAAGKEDYPEVGHLFVMGGSSTAVHLVNHMPDHMHAKILESNATRALQLNEVVKNNHTLILHGDGRDLSLLEEEGVRKAQAFVALTQHSEQNILACLAAKRLGVRKTVAMVENTDYISMAESLDIGTIINKKTFAADHIYRMMLRADITTVKSLTVANADVAEFQTPAKALVTRRPVKDLGLPDSVTLGGLVRNGKGVLINGNTVIEPGDTVVAFCLAGGIKKLERFFK